MNRRGTLFLRLLVVCGLAVFVPVGFGLWTAFSAVGEMGEAELRVRMDALAERRVRSLEAFLSERMADASLARRSPVYPEALAELAGRRAPPVRTSRRGPVPPTAAAVAREQLRALAGRAGCADAFLINTNGDLVLSGAGRPELGGNVAGPTMMDSALTRAVLAARASGQAAMSEFRMHRPTGRLSVFVVAPVNGVIPGGQGYLGLEIPAAAIHQRIREEGEGVRGVEVLLAAAEREHVLFLSPLRDSRAPPVGGAVLAGAIPAGSPLALALRGERGAGPREDLFGNRVQAWWGPVARLRCAMVVSVEAGELGTGAQSAQRRLWVLGIVTVGFSILAIWLGIRGVVRPVEDLAEAAERVGTGDGEARTGVRTPDEAGAISEVLDQTLERLQAAVASRGDLERQRQELRQRNGQLEEWVRSMTADRERRGAGGKAGGGEGADPEH